jgi:diacylglycerol kinase (ATP)
MQQPLKAERLAAYTLQHMKNRSFLHRLGFALNGIGSAVRTEASFRTQLVAAVLAAVVLAILRPPLGWVVGCIVVAAAVLAAELFNTALEQLADRLHPDIHPAVERAKDCAAGAVLMLSIAAAVVGLATIAVALRWI